MRVVFITSSRFLVVLLICQYWKKFIIITNKTKSRAYYNSFLFIRKQKKKFVYVVLINFITKKKIKSLVVLIKFFYVFRLF